MHFIGIFVLEILPKLGHFVAFFRGTKAGLERVLESFLLNTLREWKSLCNVFAEISHRMAAFLPIVVVLSRQVLPGGNLRLEAR